MRSSISPAAFRVNVIATIASGFLTIASSRKNPLNQQFGLAGSGGRAHRERLRGIESRPALLGIGDSVNRHWRRSLPRFFEQRARPFLYAAERDQFAMLTGAGALFRIHDRMPFAKLRRQLVQHRVPLAYALGERARLLGFVEGFHAGQGIAFGAEAFHLHLARFHLREGERGDVLAMRGAVDRQLRIVRTIRCSRPRAKARRSCSR